MMSQEQPNDDFLLYFFCSPKKSKQKKGALPKVALPTLIGLSFRKTCFWFCGNLIVSP